METSTDNELKALRAKIENYETWFAELDRVCKAAAKGDLEPRIVGTARAGSLGQTLGHVNHLLDMTDAFVREAGASLDHAAHGKFYRKVITRGFLGSFASAAEIINQGTNVMHEGQLKLSQVRVDQLSMADNFETQVGAVVEAVANSATNLEVTASALAEGAASSTKEAIVVEKSARDVSENVSSMAAAAEELSSSINEISRQVTMSTEVTSKAVSGAHLAKGRTNDLRDASVQIGEVVQLISKVAQQTNLLALNATIEAARAGEAGKGFAVVANEVKALATQTKSATEEIESQVLTIQKESGLVFEAITGIDEAIGQVDEIVSTIASAMTEQEAVSQEMSRNTLGASSGTNNVTRSIEGVSTSLKSNEAAADNLHHSAGQLAQHASRLNSEVENFLTSIRDESQDAT